MSVGTNFGPHIRGVALPFTTYWAINGSLTAITEVTVDVLNSDHISVLGGPQAMTPDATGLIYNYSYTIPFSGAGSGIGIYQVVYSFKCNGKCLIPPPDIFRVITEENTPGDISVGCTNPVTGQPYNRGRVARRAGSGAY